ncbi:hypothetical protein PAAG_12181 [Paracoccidioides lutzii Pb01]|uniref:Uncharacterized protein n=1 Tax=Paracoccidioides lutzii (strain ATCC MYA-826 / Pb01) TaxID=502779 RepID=A0A0A2V0Y1_PARBA|nr:hypothetical protein PAAG_12181 [Paracoccidioides lutzii Pb01]KGQ01143.1 hypothetical protein PAAG_12181 [Paracoccidioides lutzii Pb01]
MQLRYTCRENTSVRLNRLPCPPQRSPGVAEEGGGEVQPRDMLNMDGTVTSMRQPCICNEMLRRISHQSETPAEPPSLSEELSTTMPSLVSIYSSQDMRPVKHVVTGDMQDFIRIMGGRRVTSPTDRLQNMQFTTKQIQAIGEEARSYPVCVIAHAYTSQAIRHSIDNGTRGIVHRIWPGFLSEESASKTAAVLQTGLQSLKFSSDTRITLYMRINNSKVVRNLKII